MGLYALGGTRHIQAGDMVVAWPPRAARRLAADRHYLPLAVPMVKRVAAVAGARVCASGTAIRIDGDLAAIRRRRDRAGRRLPTWDGCKVLKPGELLLISSHVPDAFDGRYFGLTHMREVVGKGHLLWRS